MTSVASPSTASATAAASSAAAAAAGSFPLLSCSGSLQPHRRWDLGRVRGWCGVVRPAGGGLEAAAARREVDARCGAAAALFDEWCEGGRRYAPALDVVAALLGDRGGGGPHGGSTARASPLTTLALRRTYAGLLATLRSLGRTGELHGGDFAALILRAGMVCEGGLLGVGSDEAFAALAARMKAAAVRREAARRASSAAAGAASVCFRANLRRILRQFLPDEGYYAGAPLHDALCSFVERALGACSDSSGGGGGVGPWVAGVLRRRHPLATVPFDTAGDAESRALRLQQRRERRERRRAACDAFSRFAQDGGGGASPSAAAAAAAAAASLARTCPGLRRHAEARWAEQRDAAVRAALGPCGADDDESDGADDCDDDDDDATLPPESVSLHGVRMRCDEAFWREVWTVGQLEDLLVAHFFGGGGGGGGGGGVPARFAAAVDSAGGGSGGGGEALPPAKLSAEEQLEADLSHLYLGFLEAERRERVEGGGNGGGWGRSSPLPSAAAAAPPPATHAQCLRCLRPLLHVDAHGAPLGAVGARPLPCAACGESHTAFAAASTAQAASAAAEKAAAAAAAGRGRMRRPERRREPLLVFARRQHHSHSQQRAGTRCGSRWTRMSSAVEGPVPAEEAAAEYILKECPECARPLLNMDAEGRPLCVPAAAYGASAPLTCPGCAASIPALSWPDLDFNDVVRVRTREMAYGGGGGGGGHVPHPPA